MANQVTLPRLGQGMESGTITRWLKSEGDTVEKGEPLYELDTEKVTQEVEADASGVLLKILVQEGEVPVGETVAVIGEQGEDLPEAPSGNGGAPATSEREETPDRVQPDEGGSEVGAEKPAEGPEREDERERGRQAAGDDAEDEPTMIKEPDSADTTVAEPQPAERRDGARIKA